MILYIVFLIKFNILNSRYRKFTFYYFVSNKKNVDNLNFIWNFETFFFNWCYQYTNYLPASIRIMNWTTPDWEISLEVVNKSIFICNILLGLKLEFLSPIW